MANEENQFIETVDEEGNIINFELFDVVEFEDQEYALLLPVDDEDDSEEVILMRLVKDGEEYSFEAIETEEEFERVAEYIESLEEEIDD